MNDSKVLGLVRLLKQDGMKQIRQKQQSANNLLEERLDEIIDLPTPPSPSELPQSEIEPLPQDSQLASAKKLKKKATPSAAE